MARRHLPFGIALMYVATGTVFGLNYHALNPDMPDTIAVLLVPVSLMPAILSSGGEGNLGGFIVAAITAIQILSFLITWLLLWLAFSATNRIFARNRVRRAPGCNFDREPAKQTRP